MLALSTLAGVQAEFNFEELLWEVYLVEAAQQKLRQLDNTLKEKAFRALKELAEGTWKQCGIVSSTERIKIRCRKLEDNTYLLWMVDLAYSPSKATYHEVIQLWDVVLSDDDQYELANKIEEQLRSMKNRHFMQPPPGRDGPGSDEMKHKPRRMPQAQVESVNMAGVTSARKFFRIDTSIVAGLLHSEGMVYLGNRPVAMQFEMQVSKEEHELITREGPLLVLGKSGSGKTLTAVYRMVARHQGYWKQCLDACGEPQIGDPSSRWNHFNQVFVTHSEGLVKKVSEYFTNHLESRAGAVLPSQILKAVKDAGVEIPADLSKLPDDIRKVVLFPIFCTYRKFLIMIDGQCEQPFFPRALDGSLDEAGVAMLGGDGHRWMQTHHSRQSTVLTEVDDASFDRYFGGFRKEYRKLDPALVWKEIQTHIKGSYKILDGRPTGFLTEEEYVHIGKKLSPGLDGLRHDIYQIFIAYEAMKNRSHRFDRQDAAFHIVSQLRDGGYHGPPIHSATVDEVQDLSQVELALFFHTTPRTREKYEGLFFAGDTTQTVSRSIDCRFCDIQSLCHSYDCRVGIDKLTRNYRTHHEILALSNNVSAQIERAFPYSIDKLAPDHGQDAGPMPVIVRGQPSMGLAPGLQSDDTEGLLAFGAMQCIIVRKEESKQQVPAALRDGGLLLSVEESKGLEFDDVILLNFFKDCRCDAGIWEALLKSTVPLHDNFSFAALCNELKQLYTGMTRTIRTLVCIEEDTATCAMFDHWLQEGLVVERTLGDVATMLAQQSRASDTPHQWANQGRLLFQRSLYTNARVCFKRAGDNHMVQVCDTHALAATAQHTISVNEAEGKQMFSTAALQFGHLGMPLESAVCLRGACRWIEAAVEFRALGGTRMIDAAQCYEEADEWRFAANCYMAATPKRDYMRAVRALDRSHAAEDERMLYAIVREGHFREELTAVALDDTLKRHGGVKVSAELFRAEHLWAEAAERFEEAARLAGEDTEESDDNLEAAADCWVEPKNNISAARALEKAKRATSRLKAIDLFLSHIKNHRQCEECQIWLKETAALLRGEGIQSLVEQRVTDCVALLEERGMHMEAGDLQDFHGMTSEADSAYLRALSYYARLRRADDKNLNFDHHHTRRLVEDLVDRLENLMTTSSFKDAADICAYLAKHGQAARFYGRADCRFSQAESLERSRAFQEALDLVRALSHSEREVDLPKAFKIETSCLFHLGQRLESARIDVRHLLPSGPSQQEQSERSVELLSILKEKVTLEAFANFVDSEVLNTARDKETIAKAFIDKAQTERHVEPALVLNTLRRLFRDPDDAGEPPGLVLNTLRRLFRDPSHARVPSRPLTQKLYELEAICCEQLGNTMEAVGIYMHHLVHLPEHVETVLRLVPAKDIRDFVATNKDKLEKHSDLLAAAYKRKAFEEFHGRSYEIALSMAEAWRKMLGQSKDANAAWFEWKASHKLEVDCRVQLRQPEEDIARSILGRFQILMETTRNHSLRKLSEHVWLVPLLSAWTKNRSLWRSELDECMRLVPLSAWKLCIKHLQDEDYDGREPWNSQQRVILEKVESLREVEGRMVALAYLENEDYVAPETRTCEKAVSLWLQLVMGSLSLSDSLWKLLACVLPDMMPVKDAKHLTLAVEKMLPEIELESAREMMNNYPQVVHAEYAQHWFLLHGPREDLEKRFLYDNDPRAAAALSFIYGDHRQAMDMLLTAMRRQKLEVRLAEDCLLDILFFGEHSEEFHGYLRQVIRDAGFDFRWLESPFRAACAIADRLGVPCAPPVVRWTRFQKPLGCGGLYQHLIDVVHHLRCGKALRPRNPRRAAASRDNHPDEFVRWLQDPYAEASSQVLVQRRQRELCRFHDWLSAEVSGLPDLAWKFKDYALEWLIEDPQDVEKTHLWKIRTLVITIKKSLNAPTLDDSAFLATLVQEVLCCAAGFDVAVQLLRDEDVVTSQQRALILMGLQCGDMRNSTKFHRGLRNEAARMLMDCLQHSVPGGKRDAMIDQSFHLTCEPNELFRDYYKEVNNMVYVWQYGTDEDIIQKYLHHRKPVLAAAVASMSGQHARAVTILGESNASNHRQFIEDVLVNAVNSIHIEQEACNLRTALTTAGIYPDVKQASPLQTSQLQLWLLALKRVRGLTNEEENALARKEEDLTYKKSEEEENVKKERSREATERAKNEVQRWKDELKNVQTEIAEAMKICPMLEHEVLCTRDGYKGLLRQAKQFQDVQSGRWWEQKDALRRRIARLYGLRLPLHEALYNEVAAIAKKLKVQLPPWERTLVFAASHKLSQSSEGVWKSLTQDQQPVDKLLRKATKDLTQRANQLLHTCANVLPEVSRWRVWKLAKEESDSREQKKHIDREYKQALAAAFEVLELDEDELLNLEACLDICSELKWTTQRNSLRKRMLAWTTKRPQHFVKLLQFLSETFTSQDVACADWISPAAEEVTRALQVTTICVAICDEAAIEAQCRDNTLRSDLGSRLQRLFEECEDHEACALAQHLLACRWQSFCVRVVSAFDG